MGEENYARKGILFMRVIETSKAPSAIGPYSQAILDEGIVFTSGQIPLSPETGELVGTGIREQTKQVRKNLSAVLEEAGSSLLNVYKTTCFLADIADFAAFNEVYAQYFLSKPARSCVAVKPLPKGALIEIECLASVHDEFTY